MGKLQILTNGIIKENPVLILNLGACATLAVTSSATNGLAMGLATTGVLVCSNVLISALKKIIPDKVRIPCYIVVIAVFVTIVQLLLQAYLPDINDALGLFIPLIVVNCIILGRAELFANKNSVVDSLLDGIGMGLGFTLALFAMGVIREFLGAGSFMGIYLLPDFLEPMGIFTLAPGGFFTFAVLIALVNFATKGKARKKGGCGSCPSASFCQHKEEGGDVV